MALRKPELIIGLVGAVGTDLSSTKHAIRGTLSYYGYQSVHVRLSRLMQDIPHGGYLASIDDEAARIRCHMDAGDEIRRQAGRNDAVAGLAVGYMNEFRSEHHGEQPAEGVAFILDSIKHPKEVETLRSVYRNRFILLSVQSPTNSRKEVLKRRMARSVGSPERVEDFAGEAGELMDRDEQDAKNEYGQHVRDAFTEGDIFVSTQPEEELAGGITRYFKLFFSNPFVTPTMEEYGMFVAHTAGLRTADLSRQVGAAISTNRGDIVSVGCNEVPRAFGGQYWLGDENDARDFVRGYDSNTKYRAGALRTAFDRLKEAGQLGADKEFPDFLDALKGTRLAGLTEFGRPVHAEMASLLDAAKRGVPVEGLTMFATTFPCHNCARHIIAAGIREVIYREPYEKSLAAELHDDAIVVDPSERNETHVVFRRFVGVGPRQYMDLFTKLARKDSRLGNTKPWSEGMGEPRLITTGSAYLFNEDDFLVEFENSVDRVTLGDLEDSGGPTHLRPQVENANAPETLEVDPGWLRKSFDRARTNVSERPFRFRPADQREPGSVAGTSLSGDPDPETDGSGGSS